MTNEHNIYQKEGIGWFIDMAGKVEGPLDSCEDAQRYLKLIVLACAARSEVACLERECLA